MTDIAKGLWSLLALIAVILVAILAAFATAHLLVEAARIGWGLVS